MKAKRTEVYRFNVEKKSPAFKAIYHAELENLRIAHRLAELREKQGLTQAQLARKVGTTQAGISRLENPNYHNYSLVTLEKIALALGAKVTVKLEERYA